MRRGLLLTIAVSALAADPEPYFRRLSGLGPQTVDPVHKTFEHRFDHYDEDGHTRLHCEGKIHQHVLVLDQLDGAAPLDCADDGVAITYNGTEEMPFFEGQLLVGDTRWGCLSEDGPVAAFYRRIDRVFFADETVVFATTKVSLVDVFEHLDVEFKWTPHRHPEPHETNFTVITTAPDEQSRLRKRGFWGDLWNGFVQTANTIFEKGKELVTTGMTTVVDEDRRWSLSFFNFNWDNAQSQPKDPKIKIFEQNFDKSLGALGQLSASVGVYCVECYAYMNAGLHFRMKLLAGFSGVDLKELVFTVDGQFKANADLLVSAQAKLQKTFEYDIMATLSLPSINFVIGVVPVTILPSIGLKAVADLSLTARATVTTGFDVSFTLEPTGLDRRDGQWNWLAPRTTSAFHVHPFKLEISGGAHLALSVVPKVNFHFYGLLPLSFQLRGTFDVDLQVGADALANLYCATALATACVTTEFSLKAAAGLDVITFLNWNFGAPVLPFMKEFDLLAKFQVGSKKCFAASTEQKACYYWQTGQWSDCDGCGQQYRGVACVDTKGFASPTDTLCPADRPGRRQTCLADITKTCTDPAPSDDNTGWGSGSPAFVGTTGVQIGTVGLCTYYGRRPGYDGSSTDYNRFSLGVGSPPWRDIAGCVELCRANAACRSFSLMIVSGSVGQCNLWSVRAWQLVGTPRAGAGIYDVQCAYHPGYVCSYGTTRTRRDAAASEYASSNLLYRSNATALITGEECFALCQAKAGLGCQSFTFTNISGPTGLCALWKAQASWLALVPQANSSTVDVNCVQATTGLQPTSGTPMLTTGAADTLRPCNATVYFRGRQVTQSAFDNAAVFLYQSGQPWVQSTDCLRMCRENGACRSFAFTLKNATQAVGQCHLFQQGAQYLPLVVNNASTVYSVNCITLPTTGPPRPTTGRTPTTGRLPTTQSRTSYGSSSGSTTNIMSGGPIISGSTSLAGTSSPATAASAASSAGGSPAATLSSASWGGSGTASSSGISSSSVGSGGVTTSASGYVGGASSASGIVGGTLGGGGSSSSSSSSSSSGGNGAQTSTNDASGTNFAAGTSTFPQVQTSSSATSSTGTTSTGTSSTGTTSTGTTSTGTTSTGTTSTGTTSTGTTSTGTTSTGTTSTGTSSTGTTSTGTTSTGTTSTGTTSTGTTGTTSTGTTSTGTTGTTSTGTSSTGTTGTTSTGTTSTGTTSTGTTSTGTTSTGTTSTGTTGTTSTGTTGGYPAVLYDVTLPTTLDNGTAALYDLIGLRGHPNDYKVQDERGFSYWLNVGRSVIYPVCGPGVFICQAKTGFEWDQHWVVGAGNSSLGALPTDLYADLYGVALSFGAGDGGRLGVVYYVCDELTPFGQPTFLMEEADTYYFEWISGHACPGAPSRKRSELHYESRRDVAGDSTGYASTGVAVAGSTGMGGPPAGTSGPSALVGTTESVEAAGTTGAVVDPSLLNSNETLVAGVPYNVTWPQVTGDTVTLLLRPDPTKPFDFYCGAGIPCEPVPNTGSFSWVIPAGVPYGDKYAVVIVLGSNIDYFVVGPYFAINATCPNVTCASSVFPMMLLSRNCSQACGGGTLHWADQQCISGNFSQVSPSACGLSGGLAPSSLVCNARPCPDNPINAISLEPGVVLAGPSTVELTWRGGRLDGDVLIECRTSRTAGFSLCPALGLPAGPVANTLSYAWSIPAAVNSTADFQLRISSVRLPDDNETNAAESAHVSITRVVDYAFVIKAGDSPVVSVSGGLRVTLFGPVGALTFNLSGPAIAPRTESSFNATGIDIGRVMGIEVFVLDSSDVWVGEYASVRIPEGLAVFGFDNDTVQGNVSNVAANCFDAESCETCLLVSGCGWCNLGGCFAGTESGPFVALASCPAGEWNTSCTQPPMSFEGNNSDIPVGTVSTTLPPTTQQSAAVTTQEAAATTAVSTTSTGTTGTVPATPRGLSAVVGSTWVALGWSAADGLPVDVVIEVSRGLEKREVSNWIVVYSEHVSNVSYTLTELAPETSYWFRMYISNAAGRSLYSDILRLETSAALSTTSEPATANVESDGALDRLSSASRGGAIAGIVLGCVVVAVLIAAVAALAVLSRRRRQRRSDERDGHTPLAARAAETSESRERRRPSADPGAVPSQASGSRRTEEPHYAADFASSPLKSKAVLPRSPSQI